MHIVYEKFRTPNKIKKEVLGREGLAVRFIAEPFEKGYGITVGNALRRVLLTSIEAWSVVSFRLENVFHEFTAVSGIIEDMTAIVVNLKGVLLRRVLTESKPYSRGIKKVSTQLRITQDMLQEKGGQCQITVGDLFHESDFELMNPNHVLFTVTEPMERVVEFRVAVGRGYIPADRIQIEDRAFGEIVLDAIFSPVRLVNYYVEECRVGGETDLDRLILEVTTDGRMTPEEALTHAVQILALHLNVFENLEVQTISFDVEEEEDLGDRDAIINKLGLKISEIELSVRSTNCLYGANISTIAELVSKSEAEMLKYRNFGKKSLNEIKDKLQEMGLSLGMNVVKYGFTVSDSELDEGFDSFEEDETDENDESEEANE